MRFLVVQSIPLGRPTRDALKDAGGFVLAHNSDTLHRELQALLQQSWTFVLNMGNSWMKLPETYTIPVINKPENVSLTRTPGALRHFLSDLLPPWPENRDEYPLDCWIKAPGQGGRGKFKKNLPYPVVLPPEWDCQKHIEGTEYRVVTVGHRAVQGFQRATSTDDRVYEWTGLTHTPESVLQCARNAAKELPHNSLRAWDIISGEEGIFILEGNASPGMNLATTKRVVAEIQRQLEEGRIT
jgi:hypothetical protein